MKSRFKFLLVKFLYQHQRTFENEIEEKHDELFHYLEFINGNCKEIADICVFLPLFRFQSMIQLELSIACSSRQGWRRIGFHWLTPFSETTPIENSQTWEKALGAKTASQNKDNFHLSHEKPQLGMPWLSKMDEF